MWTQNITLFFIAFLIGADELLLGPILTPVGNDLSVRPESVAFFVTAYSLANAACAFFFGVLSDRYGRMRILIPASILFAAASLETGLAATFEMAMFFRVLTGAASAGMLPVAFAIASDAGGTNAVRRIAFVSAGLTLGMIMSPGLGALLTALFSWRVAFIALGLAAVPFAALTFVIKPQSHSVVVITKPKPKAPLLVPGALGALIAMGFGLGGGIGIFTLIGERLRDVAGYGTGIIGLTYVLLGVLSMAGNFMMPVMISCLGDGRRVMRIALVICLVMNVMVFSVASALPWSLLIALPLWALAGGVGSPALQYHIARLAPARRGALIALGMSLMHIGIALSASLAGIGYANGSLWVAALGTVLYGVALMVLRPLVNSGVVGQPE
ncbi:MFS transporter (plasmid) [Klebsiella pneumoniae]|nr:MFS transporter [Klebsiella pneumoniae]HBT5023681.1 MFS transporter [Klebsiella pneumoniae]HBT5164022.1 MFS transporter [Klebsiella pneumoniae]HBW3466340.1 MFS transporter [Klebsiella pneumoniae]HBW8614809.1 MFS transporter [Klebsiella pneumoniae]